MTNRELINLLLAQKWSVTIDVVNVANDCMCEIVVSILEGNHIEIQVRINKNAATKSVNTSAEKPQ
jgi:hypothetical protein